MPTINAGGANYHYVENGSGRPLLLVHGFPLDHTMWRNQIHGLGHVARVNAPDLRGFGKSEVTEGTVTMQQYADDLSGFLDALSIREPVVLCGLSMGGYIAWQFWKRHASRLAALILCDTRAAADTPETAEGRQRSAQEVEKEGLDSLAALMMEKLFAPSSLQEPLPAVAETRRVMLSASRAGVAAALRGMAARPDMTPELPNINVPCLVICGEHDVISRTTEMQEIASALPQGHYAEIAGAGHMTPLERPQEVNEECERFLRNLQKRR